MVKSLEDLATDKPEDIVAELAERAKESKTPRIPEDPVAETETDEEVEPEAEPETDGPEGEEPDDTPADEAAEETEEEPDAPASLLERLTSEYGIKHNFASDEDLVKAYANARRKISERDEDAALGRTLRDFGVQSPEDLEGLVRNKERQPETRKPDSGWSPPHQWDPAWDRVIQRVENEDGSHDYKGPPEVIRKVKEYESYVQSEMSQFMRDPAGTILRWTEPVLRGITQEEFLRNQGRTQYDKYMEENGDFIGENRSEIHALMREKGFTAMAAVEHMKLLKEHEKLASETGHKEKKAKDLKKLAHRARKRAGAAGTPIKEVRNLSKMSTRDALETIASEKGLDIPEAW